MSTTLHCFFIQSELQKDKMVFNMKNYRQMVFDM